MKRLAITLCAFLITMFSSASFAQITLNPQEPMPLPIPDAGSLNFTIDQGQVTVTPARCFSRDCGPRTSQLSGSFLGLLSSDGSELFFPSSSLTSIPDTQFQLPSDPNLDSNGTQREAIFSFNGKNIKVSGSVDSRAFDGPLIEYNFSATVSTSKDRLISSFTARPDLRKCAAPRCGGYFVKAVNKRATRCADGSRKRECYVSEIRFPDGVNRTAQRRANQTPIFLVGEIESKFSRGFGNLGSFRAKTIEYSATNRTARNSFHGVTSGGIFCITTPCFSINQSLLNTDKGGLISRVNFDRSGANKKQIEQARAIMANGSVLHTSGFKRKYKGFQGVGVELVVKQFYLPAQNEIVLCQEGYRFEDGTCRTPFGCAFPEFELTGFGGAPMIDIVTGEVTGSVTKSCSATCDEPAFISSPGQCEVFFP